MRKGLASGGDREIQCRSHILHDVIIIHPPVSLLVPGTLSIFLPTVDSLYFYHEKVERMNKQVVALVHIN